MLCFCSFVLQSKLLSSWENAHTSPVVALAQDAGHPAAVGQQKQRGQKLLNAHHGLHEMLQVHVCHLGRLCASDAIMMLDLRNPASWNQTDCFTSVHDMCSFETDLDTKQLYGKDTRGCTNCKCTEVASDS